MNDQDGGMFDLDAAWRQHSRKVLATLIRLLRDFDMAEEALHDAFLVAAQKWPQEGMPANPSAWLVSAGRFRAIDKLRRRSLFDAVQGDIDWLTGEATAANDNTLLADDQLRLIFTCCHPSLAPDGQVALTLRTVCGLTTEEIARAFLVRTLDLQFVFATRDTVVLPELSRQLIAKLKTAGVAPGILELNCGHYSLSLPPYVIRAGLSVSRLLSRSR